METTTTPPSNAKKPVSAIAKWCLLIFGVLFVLGSLLTFVVVALPVIQSRLTKSTLMTEAKEVGVAAMMYASDHNNQMPKSLTLLVPKYISALPASSAHFRYLPIDDLSKSTTLPTTIIYVDRTAGSRLAVYADGSISYITDADYHKAMTAQGVKP